MKLRLRFQTKLMLAIVAAVAMVTIAVMAMSENRVRETYRRTAEQQFEEQIDSFLQLRTMRLEYSARFLERISQLPLITNAFDGDVVAQSALTPAREAVDELLENSAQGTGARKRPGSALRNLPSINAASGGTANRVICLVDLTGKLYPIDGLREAGSKKGDKKGLKRLNQLSKVKDFEVEQYGYIVADNEEGVRMPLEVVIMPVKKPGSETELIGAVLMGSQVKAQASEAPKTNGNANAGKGRSNPPWRRSGPQMRSGLLIDGELFNLQIPAALHDEVSAAAEKIVTAIDPNKLRESEVVVWEDNRPYRVFARAVAAESSLPPSHQIVLYPLDDLMADLKDLRFKGSGIGGAALLLAGLVGWIISRSFAKPVRELKAGADEIRKGNFDTRVQVRSRDEIGQLAESFNEMAVELAYKEQLRDALGKVADEAVAQALISGSLELGGEVREVSVLFCDIRGFTSLTEHMPPAEVIDMVNQHMTAMTRVIYEHQGVVDKFIGDEIMAIFGAPKAYGPDAENAALCALKMIAERARLNQSSSCPLEIGIGVATGEVVVGCMGSTDRLNYTVLGERVNRAARLVGVAAPGEIVIDEGTKGRIGDQFEVATLEAVALKGFSESVAAFKLSGRQPHTLALS